jgi:hypothetical protein
MKENLEPTKLLCPHCHQESESRGKFCPECGKRLFPISKWKAILYVGISALFITLAYLKISKNMRLGIQKIESVALKGDLKSQRMMSLSCWFGIGRKKDLKEARRWMSMAAESGDLESEYQLGQILESGVGGDIDNKGAFENFQKSATKGYADSQIEMGRLYEKGLIVKKDFGEAKKWYELARKNPGLENSKRAGLSEKIRWISTADEKTWYKERDEWNKEHGYIPPPLPGSK